jgi:arylsulfatase B
VIYAHEPWGLDLNEILLPKLLHDLDYATALVGKWHLGHFRWECTPLHRGFDSHFGYWSGHQDYYDHTAEEQVYKLFTFLGDECFFYYHVTNGGY